MAIEPLRIIIVDCDIDLDCKLGIGASILGQAANRQPGCNFLGISIDVDLPDQLYESLHLGCDSSLSLS